MAAADGGSPGDGSGVCPDVARSLRERLAAGGVSGALSLLGHGPGSTPWGDDLLVGALAGMQAMGAIAHPGSVRRAIGLDGGMAGPG